MQLISQQQQPPSPVIMKEADSKAATRAEAALTQLLMADQQEMDTDVTLTATLISSIETFHSNLTTTTSPDELTSDEDIQRKLMVHAIRCWLRYS